MKNLLNYVHNTRLFCKCDSPPWSPFEIQLMEDQANMAGGTRLVFMTSKLEHNMMSVISRYKHIIAACTDTPVESVE